jgi:multidrug efflux system membrane fusion protein
VCESADFLAQRALARRCAGDVLAILSAEPTAWSELELQLATARCGGSWSTAAARTWCASASASAAVRRRIGGATVSAQRNALAAVVVLVVLGPPRLRISSMTASEEKKGGGWPAAVPVSVEPALQQTVPVRLQAIGNVEPYSTVALKAAVDGQIMAVNFKEGQEVRKGDVLFRIDPRPFDAALKQAEANAMRDGRGARIRRVPRNDAIRSCWRRILSRREAYAQIRTNAETAEATVSASQARSRTRVINLAYCTIASPLEGYVGKTLLQVGNLVKANDVVPLVVINQVRPIYVNFAVPEQTLGSLRRTWPPGRWR